MIAFIEALKDDTCTPKPAKLNAWVYIYIYMVVDQNSFIPERPFFANKKFTFAKLSRTPCLSFAGPMLANNASYEDSFTTCQLRQRITDHFLVAF